MTAVKTRPEKRAKEQKTEEVPDLYRDAGIFKISITYLPAFWEFDNNGVLISEPKSAFVSIKTGDGTVIDSFEVPTDQGHEALKHPVMFSDKLHKHVKDGA